MRVSQEQTWGGRLFQIVGAAERKPRAPNEMLQRVTDRRLAEADRRVLQGVCHWTRLAKYGGLPLWVIVASIVNWQLLKVAKWEPGVRLPTTTRARVWNLLLRVGLLNENAWPAIYTSNDERSEVEFVADCRDVIIPRRWSVDHWSQ